MMHVTCHLAWARMIGTSPFDNARYFGKSYNQEFEIDAMIWYK